MEYEESDDCINDCISFKNEISRLDEQEASCSTYLTTTEWSLFYGGKKEASSSGENSKFRRLPFTCCSLSMQPFENPYCTPAGDIFDIVNILPFLKQFGINPVTGEKLSSKELVKLNFSKNAAGKYHCPVTFKIFNENTHIVAVKPTGNVFCYDAIERLNIKPGFWKDLLTDEPFVRKDLITIQNPNELDKFNLANFYHIRKNLKVLDEDDEKARKDPRYNLKSVNPVAKQILDELDSTYQAPTKVEENKPKADSINAAHYSTGKVAASFTSTVMEPTTHHEAAIIDEDMLRYERLNKKSYIQIITTHGQLNVELHSDMVPKTCENFLKHCLNNYYKGTVFHRSIKNFMIQGGDPDGNGTGGQSIWGQPFKDEMKPNLTHSGRGILSMANSGPNTNKSQFFITYRSARHLDGKHAVFGRVVGGLETLDKMEKVKTDDKDRPLEEIKIIDCKVFVNPYDDVDQQLVTEREDAIAKKLAEDESAKKSKLVKKTDSGPKVFRSGVGKFIASTAMSTTKRPHEESEELSETVIKKRQKATTVTSKSKLSNFSIW